MMAARKSIRSKASRFSKSTSKERVQHMLVPEHLKVSEKEKEELFKAFNITNKELPKIFITDPAVRHLDVKENDIVKVIRIGTTGGKSIFYRGVINE